MGNDLQLYESQQLKVMIEVANSMPRDLENFVDNVYGEVMQDVENNRDFALSCIYCVPVGRDNSGMQKFHSGPSVRITEVMQKYWKHLRVIVTGEITEDEIKVNGLIVDCQGNNSETLVDRVSCKGWKDRRKSLKLKAMQSVMKRDLRLSIMGKGYADRLKNKIFDGIFPDAKSGWDACIKAYDKIGVKKETLFSYFKVSGEKEITKEILFNALGIYNYLKETGEDTESIFGGKSNKPNVSPSDIEITPRKKGNNPIKSKESTGKAPSSPKQGGEPPIAMDQEEFASLVASLSLQTGIPVETALKDVTGVDHPDDVLMEDYGKVIDYFEAQKETEGL